MKKILDRRWKEAKNKSRESS